MAETTKDEVIRFIERMPDDSSLDDIMYELYFRSRVERGLEQARSGETVSHDEVVKSIVQWLQSVGH